MGELPAELRRLSGTTYDAAGAANAWAGTSGLELVGALNAKAGTVGLELNGVLNRLAGTTGLGTNAAVSAITGSATVLVSDTFTRASPGDGTLGTADTGQTWVSMVGAWGIVSGEAALTTFPGLAVVNAGASNYTIQATVSVADTGSALTWRVADNNNRYSVLANTTALTVFKRVAGVVSSLGTASAGSAGGDVIKVDVRGSVFTVYRNGVQLLQVSDSDVTSTNVGFRADTTSARFDNFTVTA